MKRIAWLLFFATIPAVVGGYFLQDLAETSFRSPVLVSINLIWVAIAMFVAERHAKHKKQKTKLEDTTNTQGMIVGFSQVLALIPGVSRSGITITTGIFAGLDRVSATRFSFLLAIPVTFGAIVKVFMDSDTLNHIGSESGVFVAGILAAFVSGIFAIRFMLQYLSKHSLAVFAYYRIVLGVIVLLLLAR